MGIVAHCVCCVEVAFQRYAHRKLAELVVVDTGSDDWIDAEWRWHRRIRRPPKAWVPDEHLLPQLVTGSSEIALPLPSLLRDALTQWMNGVLTPKGMPSYDNFVHGVTSALDHVRKQHMGNVLIVSSGGPISTAVGHILGTTPETTIELNLRIRNSSVTELAFTPKRHMLVTYNTLPHLDHADYADWVTYS